MNNTRERERNGQRMSMSQMEKMLHLIEQKPELAASYLTAPSAKSKVKELWNEAAPILNAEYGAFKSGEKWQKAWIDWKSKTLIKVRQLSAKGDATYLRNHLNAVELRLAAMLDSSIHLDKTGDGNSPFSLEHPRDRKMTLSQMTTLLDMIEKEPELVVSGAGCSKFYNRDHRRRAWNHVARMLNADTNGPTKTAVKWQKTLVDWKYKTRFKFRQYEQKLKRKGKKPDFRKKFTKLECKLAKLMGWIENNAEERSDDGALIAKFQPATSPSSSSTNDEADELNAQQPDSLYYTPEGAEETCAQRLQGVRDVEITIKRSPSPTSFSPPLQLSPSPGPPPERPKPLGAESERDETINEFLQLERQKVAALRCMAEAVTGLRSDLRRYFTYLIDDHHKPFSQT